MINNLPFPKYITFEKWSAELIKNYKDERLPVPRAGEEWQEWANKIAGVGVFRTNGIPSATNTKGAKKANQFKNWDDWAKAVYIVMINAKGKKK